MLRPKKRAVLVSVEIHTTDSGMPLGLQQGYVQSVTGGCGQLMGRRCGENNCFHIISNGRRATLQLMNCEATLFSFLPKVMSREALWKIREMRCPMKSIRRYLVRAACAAVIVTGGAFGAHNSGGMPKAYACNGWYDHDDVFATEQTIRLFYNQCTHQAYVEVDSQNGATNPDAYLLDASLNVLAESYTSYGSVKTLQTSVTCGNSYVGRGTVTYHGQTVREQTNLTTPLPC